MKMRILGPRALIKPTKKEEKTKGGIYLPDTADEEKKEGTVVAVGKYDDKDRKDMPFPVKPGDKVIFGGFSEKELMIDGEKHLIVDVKDVMAVLE
ncbi:MAG TPA: co-chaperone GroES [Candidatus Woesearchaeota archaeon]|nr:co-chaperone GroES [Candidatus Woesearchaeota archaeon]